MVEIRSRSGLLRLVLIIVGIIFSISGAGVFLSVSQLKDLTGLFVSPGEVDSIWPEEALFDYLLRTSCIAYLWIGITFFIAAKDPSRYKVLVHLAIAGLLLFGVVCLAVGIKDQIPLRWYLGDSLLSFLGGILLIILRPRK